MSNQYNTDNTDIFNQEYDIGFIVAMEEELQSLLIQDPEIVDTAAFKTAVNEATRLGNARFIPFKLQTYIADDQEVTLNCLACLTGIGKINAAMGTTALLTRFKVDTLINLGLFGSLTDDPIGTVYFIDHVIAGDTNVKPFGYAYGQVPGEKSAFYATPPKFVNSLYALASQRYKVSRGICITTDLFIDNMQFADLITKEIVLSCQQEGIEPNLVGFDMELVAIAQVANAFGRKVISIKEKSDSANESAKDDFANTASQQQQVMQYTIDIINDTLPNIYRAIQVKRFKAAQKKA